MNNTIRFLALPVLLALLLASRSTAAHAPDEIIVKMKPAFSRSEARLLSTAPAGAKIKKKADRLGYQTLKLPKGAKLEDALARLRQDPAVAYAGPNHVLRIASTLEPNDPIYQDGWDYLELGFIILKQWGLYNDGLGSGFGGGGVFRADIKAPEAWAINTGSPTMVIAVLDTGLNYNHPDVATKMWKNTDEVAGNGIDDDGNGLVDDWRGWDFANNDNDPMDDHNDMGSEVHHGTFTSAIAAASTNDGTGMAGVSWGSPIMALKVMDSTGYGLEDVAAEAVIYAADNGAKIINMSLTGEDAPALKDAIDYAWSKGCLIVAASGNAGTSVDTYPASYENVLSVGATNESDARCTAADWGTGGSNYGQYLDVMAPGNNILSCTNMMEPDGYFVLPGTSAAAPFVAGVAALVWSEYPGWTNAQVFSQITRTADDIDQPGWDMYTGWGRVNAYRALTESTPETTSIAEVKQMDAGEAILLKDVVLTTGSGQMAGRLYGQSSDRSSGILMLFSTAVPEGLSIGDVVEVYGTLGDEKGEVAIRNATVTKTGSAEAPAAMMMSNKTLGGAALGNQQGVVDQYSFPQQMAQGLNNIGLLVRTSGKVTAVGTDWFYIDDGAHLDDGGAYTGVFVYHGALQRPGIGKYVSITGISSCEVQPGATVARRVLRPRQQADIVLVK